MPYQHKHEPGEPGDDAHGVDGRRKCLEVNLHATGHSTHPFKRKRVIGICLYKKLHHPLSRLAVESLASSSNNYSGRNDDPSPKKPVTVLVVDQLCRHRRQPSSRVLGSGDVLRVGSVESLHHFDTESGTVREEHCELGHSGPDLVLNIRSDLSENGAGSL